MKDFYRSITHPRVLIGVGWFMVIASLVGWPLTALTVAKNEPFVILSISWLALVFAGYSVVAAGHADLRVSKQEK